jgi:superoxide reductase
MKFLKCEICGKILAVVDERNVPTMCCGKPMSEIPVNTQDGAHEKHVPVYEIKDNVVTVKVGEVTHPMVDNHFIQWIALETNLGNQRKVLSPNEEPVAKFALLPGEEVLAVYEYCNLHGLWKADL